MCVCMCERETEEGEEEKERAIQEEEGNTGDRRRFKRRAEGYDVSGRRSEDR